MSIKDQDRLEQLRQRLYERGRPTNTEKKFVLEDNPEPAPTTWSKVEKNEFDIHEPKIAEVKKEVEHKSAPVRVAVPKAKVEEDSDRLYEMPKKKKTYRLKLVLLGLAFFVISVALSSLFLISGNNVISGENISIAITGPFTVGGGEAIPLQVGIINDNAVPIQSATLIVEYPEGTKSVNDNSKDLFTERLPLETINSGETLNIPLRAIVYGEENDEKEIKVSIEYRVSGSNALFFKEAESLKFKISSSPVSLVTKNIEKITSGQETLVYLTVQSNSPTDLSDIMVRADYPNAFDFVSSDPEPSLSENVWIIESLKPEESKTIELTGIIVGQETDEYVIDVAVGVPAERNPQNMASVFATEQIDFIIEQPFIDITLEVNNQEDEVVVIKPGSQFTSTIEVRNTLDDTIYDTEVFVQLSGNAISEVDINPRNGFYDSSNNTVTWRPSENSQLEEIAPGRSERVSLTITPSEDVNRTPQIEINVSVKARRVSEGRATEQLNGGASTIVKVLSEPKLASDAGYNNSIYTDVGPVPPEADTETSYTISFMIENGSNDIADAEVSASLPPYVTWSGSNSGVGSVSFNEATRVLTWKAGSVDANTSVFGNFQVVIKPSQSQIGSTPTLVGEQRLTATDLFTKDTVRATSRAITTELSTEAGFDRGNGRVTN